MNPVSTDDILGSLRLAGSVERYHTWPIRKPTVADSTWHVMRIYLQAFGSPPAAVWEYILLHDVDEIGTGDVPFHAKRRWPALKLVLDEAEEDHRKRFGRTMPSLTDIEWRRFKACDLLEMHEFARTELAMGNSFAVPVIQNVEAALAKMENPLGQDDWRAVKRHMNRRMP